MTAVALIDASTSNRATDPWGADVTELSPPGAGVFDAALDPLLHRLETALGHE